MSNYCVAQSGQDMFFFYPSENPPALRYRIWREGQLLDEDNLHAGIRLPFSVFHQGDLLHVFCQDAAGSTLLFTYRDGAWGNRTILRGDAVSVLLTPMISDDSLCVLYNGFTEEADASSLFKRFMSGAGEWQQAVTIDHYSPFPFTPYVAQATGPEHLILFYQTHGPAEERQVGYREVTPLRTGPFHRFLNAQGTLLDASYLTTHDAVHVLMIVRTAFSCQLLYRKKADDVFTPPALLWESPKIEHCLLTIVGNDLYATCMIGGKLNRAVSADFGDTFGPMGLYKRKFCAEPVKADFAANEQLKGWFARQVYVDRGAPWDVQMIPDLCPGFYPGGVKESDRMKELKDSLAAAQLALDAKDKQILELMYRAKVSEES